MSLRFAYVAVITAAFAAGCGDDDDGPATDAGPADATVDGRVLDALVPDAGPPCGNGVLDGLEQCDNTTQFNGTNACSTTCQSVEFALNTVTAGDQGRFVDSRTPGLDVAAMASLWGVVWTDDSTATSDIRMRLLSRRGAPQTNGIDATMDDFVINMRAGTQFGPRITARNTTSDDFAVAWLERGTGADALFIRQYGGDATPSDINLGEANVGATDVLALNTLSVAGGAYVATWRERVGELRARQIMPGTSPLMMLGTAPIQFGFNLDTDAELSILPAPGNDVWALVDRGGSNPGRRARYTSEVWDPAPPSGLAAFSTLDPLPFHAHVEVPSAQRGMVVVEGAAPRTDPLKMFFFQGDDVPGTPVSVGTRAVFPAAAGNARGFVVVWVEQAVSASGLRNQVRAATFALDGTPILQPRFDGISGSFLVTSRATPASADDIGPTTPRVALAPDGSVLVVWRDYAARTGAGTAADTLAEIRGRLFPRLLP